MKNLQEKLNALYGRADVNRPDGTAPSDIRVEINRLLSNRIPIKHFPKAEVEKASLSLDKLVDGRWINTHFGDIFRGEFAFDLREIYGKLDLAEIFRFSEADYQECFHIPGIISPDKFLFIDTETTGLAGGSGTVAFLVGLGWIDKDKFIVHQYFITQLSHEEGMLELLNDVVKRFDCLVSFNGKTFDIPLLTTRFLMNRIDPLFESRHHIDLLYYTRLLWRLAMENCKLKTLETELLGLNREDDIPGEIIPKIYFEYLRTRNTEKLERIFYHNRFDIISMLAGLILATRTMQKRTPENNPLVDFAKGKWFGKKKDAERSRSHYQHVLESQVSLPRRQKTMLELATIYKRNGEYSSAIPLWEETTNPEYPFSFEPFIELAKYYEHIEKDVRKALMMVESGVVASPTRWIVEQPMISKRIERLRKKIEK